MRNRYVLILDLPLIALAAFGAFAARFDFQFYNTHPELWRYLLAALIVKPVIFMLLGMYGRYWRYASVQELVLIAVAVTAASTAMALVIQVAMVLGLLPGFSRVVFLTDWALTLAATGGLRFAVRALNEPNMRSRRDAAGDLRRILIVGAGDAGTMVAREMRRNPQLGMQPVGFLDDDSRKIGKQIAGLRVLGETHLLPKVIESYHVETVVIAMPAARGPVVRGILELCRQADVKSQTIPGVFELLDGHVSVNRLRSVNIEDLLRRAPVNGHVDTARFVAGRVVLITGGGGSIGFELARQIANASPSHLVLLGHGENSIFEAEARLRALYTHLPLSTAIADIRDERRLAVVFDRVKPAIVFHAAAHKHVPLMEENPEEAVTNNVIGTLNVVNQAVRIGAERFVLISSDKAVSPTSVMGSTKRLAEQVVQRAARITGRAFVAVRFGNVLGSRGSVVNTFKEQIARGGPITVTHPDMTRYFMTIPEAIHLVLQASGHGRGGELFVLDMGEPVKIVQLARDLIKLSGLREDDIPIVFTGIRPGEKLEEVLFDAEIETLRGAHPQVLQVVGRAADVAENLDTLIAQLQDAAVRGDRTAVFGLLRQVFPALNGAQDPPVPGLVQATRS